MRNAFLTSIAALVTGAGVVMAQSGMSAIPNVSPAFLDEPPSALTPKKEGSCPPSELPPAPVESGWGVWVPNGPNAFATPEPMARSPFDLCGPDRFWFRGDYIFWWVRQQSVPGPLVTTGNTATRGVFEANGTSVLLGGDRLDYGPLSGSRLFLGFANCDHTWALEAGAIILESGRTTFQETSDAAGNPVLSRPFIDVLHGQVENALPVSSPGAFAGSIRVTSTNDLTGGELNLWHCAGCNGPNLSFLLGFRYLFLQESLAIAQQSDVLPGGVASFNGNLVTSPARLGIADTFETRNDFYGGQIGIQSEFHPGPFFATMTGKLGIGNTHEVANSFGQSTLSQGGISTTVPGGFFAVPATSALVSRNEFTLIPEFTLNVGIEVTTNLRLFVGYTFLYWDDVVRPGNQFDRLVNTSLVPTSNNFGRGPATAPPTTLGDGTQFWAQGINFGATFRY
jgi:hypothetical protein